MRRGTVREVDLTVVLGPMKSGKSLELVSQVAPLAFSHVSHRVFQSSRHGRDAQVVSRSGGTLPTVKVDTLADVLCEQLEVVGIDEVHMFTREDVAAVEQLLARGTKVIVCGIDTDHRGRLFDTVAALLELGPAQVIYRRSVCDVCRDFCAVYTQVLAGDEPFTADLSGAALPDDGTFTYEARCRSCFVRPA